MLVEMSREMMRVPSLSFVVTVVENESKVMVVGNKE